MYLGNKEMTMNSKLLNKVTAPSLTFVINVIDIEAVWFKLKAASKFHVLRVFFFFPCTWTVKSHDFTVQDKKHCSYTVHGSHTLFTNLKIILLQCFQFSVSATISSIQTDPLWILMPEQK